MACVLSVGGIEVLAIDDQWLLYYCHEVVEESAAVRRVCLLQTADSSVRDLWLAVVWELAKRPTSSDHADVLHDGLVTVPDELA